MVIWIWFNFQKSLQKRERERERINTMNIYKIKQLKFVFQNKILWKISLKTNKNNQYSPEFRQKDLWSNEMWKMKSEWKIQKKIIKVNHKNKFNQSISTMKNLQWRKGWKGSIPPLPPTVTLFSTFGCKRNLSIFSAFKTDHVHQRP